MSDGENRVKNTVLTQTELIKKLEAWFSAGTDPFPLAVTGRSMLPFIRPGRDTAFLYPPEGKLKKGDVILFVSRRGRLLLHRVVKTDGERIMTAGDAFSSCDEGAEASGVIAVCRGVKRKGKLYGEKSPYWLFFSVIWIRMLRFRGPVIRAYSALGKAAKKRGNDTT